MRGYPGSVGRVVGLRGPESNRVPPGYGPGELPVLYTRGDSVRLHHHNREARATTPDRQPRDSGPSEHAAAVTPPTAT